ncbi:hypothetical protein [Methanospirillum hungatei]|uniref:hypothetical protein n=1 Tax=Methanospirillum hungatei TaxID=2203 RepID=UPI0026F334B2|nr:hypothetical protein [Methanospirillum hungatei]MCA1915842.1 hypothetical protein [Methanospirillum hungatei]
MKGLMAVLLIGLIGGLAGITTAEIPNLVGNWTGPYIEYTSGQGFSDIDSGLFFVNITEQKDRIIIGYSLYQKSDGTKVIRELAGVISADGTELSLAEQNNGYSNGKIIGPDEFELTYRSDHDPIRVAIDTFYRIT